jgi:hypothetical protein
MSDQDVIQLIQQLDSLIKCKILMLKEGISTEVIDQRIQLYFELLNLKLEHEQLKKRSRRGY